MNHPFKVDEQFRSSFRNITDLKQVLQFTFGESISIHYCNFIGFDFYTYKENINCIWHIKAKL